MRYVAHMLLNAVAIYDRLFKYHNCFLLVECFYSWKWFRTLRFVFLRTFDFSRHHLKYNTSLVVVYRPLRIARSNHGRRSSSLLIPNPYTVKYLLVAVLSIRNIALDKGYVVTIYVRFPWEILPRVL